MRRSIVSMPFCALLIAFLPAAGIAQLDLLSPTDECGLLTSPVFEWTTGDYDAFLFYSMFHYDLENYDGYYPVAFWTLGTQFALPLSWWEMLTVDATHYWAVVGLNTTTWAFEVSNPMDFGKRAQPIRCDGSCCDGSGWNMCPDGRYCLTTAEGYGSCNAGTYYCPGQDMECSSSADCPCGYVCLVCTCCSQGTGLCFPDH